MWNLRHKLASPPHFYDLAAKVIPSFAVFALGFIVYGTIAGLFFAPPDYQQGNAFRINYVHVPAAYLSMLAYVVMAISAGIGLIWRMKLAHAVAAGAALVLVGAINVPIIHFSVEWWSSLHQGPTLVRQGGPAIEPAMLYPLLAMILGFSLLFGALLVSRVRSEVLYRERRTRWVRSLLMPVAESL